MKTLFVAAILFCSACPFAFAGPNAGGTLVVYADSTITYTDGDVNQYCTEYEVSDCPIGGANLPPGSPDVWHVWAVIAFFPASSSPVLGGVFFGVAYDPTAVYVGDYRCCGDDQAPSPGWPGPDTGVMVFWDPPETGHSVTVYWFAGWGGSGATFCLTAFPGEESGYFWDGQRAVDPVAGLGCLGFGTDSGFVPCPEDALACCRSDGSCEVLLEYLCNELGGQPYPPFVSCEPNPCPPPTPTTMETWGRIKANHR